jgi:tRNA1(Val) A37 N6-methylase TrmN6
MVTAAGLINLSYSKTQKQKIARDIKPITRSKMSADFQKLQQLFKQDDCAIDNISYGIRYGNNTVDYYTFAERLETRGKYNANYYDFLSNIDEFKKKKFIQNMIYYYDTVKNKTRTKNNYVVLKEVYNICISAINIFRPIVAADIYRQYKPTSVLDFTCGWGGRLIGACAVNVPRYTGIDINTQLRGAYQKMIKDIIENNDISTTTVPQVFLEDALEFDYSTLKYDLVLTSPPYYSIERYPENQTYTSHKDMNERFYKPLFSKTFYHLQLGGHYCLNVNAEIYTSVCVQLFGEAQRRVPLKKSARQTANNNYKEFIYIWEKTEDVSV